MFSGSRGKRTFTTLSWNELSKRTGTAKFRIAPETTIALEYPTLTCDVAVPTTLTVCLVGLYNAGWLFV